MEGEVIALLAAMAFVVLILLEMPIGIAITLAGIMGVLLLDDRRVASSVLATTPYTASAKYALFVIPMYVLLGALISNAGIGAQIYRVINKLVRWLPGGLGATAVLATAVFSGISGSSAADVATFGRISVTEMSRHGYRKPYAAAIVAAAGTFAVLIPPSIILVIYGILASESIPALILAGVVPGVISAAALAVFVILRAVVERPAAAGATSPPAPEVVASAAGGRLVTARGDAIALAYAALLFVIVVGGLYGGVFTASEAGAVGAFAALVIAIVARRSREKPLRRVLIDSFRETANVTSMIFLLLIGGSIFTYFVASANVPASVTRWALGLPVSPAVLVAVFLLLMIPLGMFLDGLSILLLTVPLAAPVVTQLGFDGVWFGILAVKMVEIGLITPPVGINVFIISGIADIPSELIFRRVLPFVLLDLAITALFFLIPDIVLWLPRLAGQG